MTMDKSNNIILLYKVMIYSSFKIAKRFNIISHRWNLWTYNTKRRKPWRCL